MKPKVSSFLKAMRPVFPLQDETNVRIGNSELSSYLMLFLALFSKCVDSFYVFYGKSCIVVAASTRHTFSLRGIFHVLRLISYIKMFRIYAFRIVAMMTDIHFFRYFSFMKFPGITMSKYSASFPSVAEPTVATMIHRANPIPAFACFANIAKESFLKCRDRIFSYSHDMSRSKIAFFLFNRGTASTFTQLHNFVPPYLGLEHNTKLLGEI